MTDGNAYGGGLVLTTQMTIAVGSVSSLTFITSTVQLRQ